MVPSSMDRNKREGAAESIHVGQQAKHSTSGRDISVKESGKNRQCPCTRAVHSFSCGFN